MVCQLSCRGRVDAMLKDGLTGSDASSNGLAQILQGKEESVDYAHMPVTPAQIAEILKKRQCFLLNTILSSSNIYNLPDDNIAISVCSLIPQMRLSFPPALNFPCRCNAVIVPLAVKNRMRGIAPSSSTIPTHENTIQDLSS